MNNRALIALTLVFGLGLSALLALLIFGNRGNSLTDLYLYLTISGGILGMLKPRLGVYVLVFSTAYLDLLKRLLVFGGRFSVVDLYLVLGFAPIIMLGISVGTVLGLIVGRRGLDRSEVTLIGLSVLLVGIVAAVAYLRTESPMKVVEAVATGGSFTTLLFVVPALFPRSEDFKKLLLYICVVFVPVALYALYQSVFGITRFEYQYLLSGLTTEVRQLDELVFRPFSTLNSAHSLSLMMACLMVLAAIGATRRRAFDWLFKNGFLVALFAAAAFVSLTRSGWVSGLVAFTCAWAFARPLRVAAFYVSGAAVVVALFVFAGPLTTFINQHQGMVARAVQGDFGLMALHVGTFMGRLEGMENLMNDPSLWKPFGLAAEIGRNGGMTGHYFSHDGISAAILQFGYIPTFIGVLIAVAGIYRLHSAYLKWPDCEQKRMVVLGLALAVGILANLLFSPEALNMFPTNVYFWLFLGMTVSIVKEGRALGLHRKPVAEPAAPVAVFELVEDEDEFESLSPARLRPPDPVPMILEPEPPTRRPSGLAQDPRALAGYVLRRPR